MHHAEDAFQAVFLILAHRARSIHRHGSIASWLYGVAHRVASRARVMPYAGASRRTSCSTDYGKLLAARGMSRWSDTTRRDQRPSGAASCGRGALLPGRFDIRGGGPAASGVRGDGPGSAGASRRRCGARLTAEVSPSPPVCSLPACGWPGAWSFPRFWRIPPFRSRSGFMAGKNVSVLAEGVLSSMVLNQLKVPTVLLLWE